MRAACSPDRNQTTAGAISHRRPDRTYSTPSWCEPDRRPSARPIRRSPCSRVRRQCPRTCGQPPDRVHPRTPGQCRSLGVCARVLLHSTSATDLPVPPQPVRQFCASAQRRSRCETDDQPQGTRATPGSGSPRQSTTTRPYSLLMHCGIEWARIDDAWWQAETPLSDGSGNPPAGWAHPTQSGTLRRIDRSTMEFVAPAGSIVFHRTELTRQPVSCD